MNVEEIFSQAMQIQNQADRAAYLEKACAGDSQLRGRVESLLAAHQEAASFLDNPAKEISAETTSPDEGLKPIETLPPTTYRPITEGPGTVIGHYKLLQSIGEGGMGVVYMAEQEKPVRRRVALKIIKPGMDSQQVIARFEAERQALAMMDHPNIARVFDAGCTDTGRPYFVMELVQGIPITKYCDDKQLDTHARLELFVQVCNAIQHAHQKGIIHRDLKPSNVLVAIYDAKPVPKIIDFGVAKALHQRLTEKTMFTQFGAVVGTLEYMSPEQADMDLMGTDTRSDIYSLGVLLYELLTGSTPMDGKKLRSLGYAEMLKTIREVDPPKPSTRLSQSINEVASISARRQTEPRRLQKLIAGDLDWIVMKCLEKDRTRRYETANGLAQDIQRHLHDEAVAASPPGQIYKFQKLVRRNKLACAAVASVMLALVLGLAASLWQAGRAAREAERASREAERARLAEQQALATLDELRATAPTFAAQAQALASKGQFDQAMDKLDHALKFQPDNPEHLVAKGDLYLCRLKFPEAAALYRDALRLKPGIAPAQTKATLCDQLLADPSSAQGKLSLESLSIIYKSLDPQNRSPVELKAVRDSYVDQRERRWNSWLPRLQALPMFAKIPLDGNPMQGARFDVRDDGRLILLLGQMDPGDLSQLKDLPIADLFLSNSLNVTDVGPLADMRDLENVTVPPLARNIQALHKLPNLKRISFSSTPTFLDPGEQNRIFSMDIEPQMRANEQHADPKFNPSEMMRRAILFDITGPWMHATPDTTAEQFWKEYAALSWLPRLRDSAIKPNQIRREADGTWIVDFEKKELSDLTFLHGMPISHLFIGNNPVSDLTPLRGMPLVELNMWKTKVADLTPLKGMPLTIVWADWTNVTDISPLEGMPLNALAIDGDQVSDLSPLRGMPLKMLRLRDCTNLTNLSLLADLKQLTALILPPNFTDFEFLHTLPKLERLSFDQLGSGDFGPDKSADEFWASLATEMPWVAPLHKANIPYKLRRISSDHSWELVLDGQPISDLSIFKGGNVSVLSLTHTPVTDLSPLMGMKLTGLRLSGTKVADLWPIKAMSLQSLSISGTLVSDLKPLMGMPLRQLYMTNCQQITDLSPIAGMADTMENMTLPPNVKNIEFLRKFPKLKRLSFKWDTTAKVPAQSADQFWAEYDRKQNAAATQPVSAASREP
jgi:serine/threonine protein kinase